MKRSSSSAHVRRRCGIVTLDAKLLIARIGLLFSHEAQSALHWVEGDIAERDVVIKTSDERPNALLDQIDYCLRDGVYGGSCQWGVYSEDASIAKWLVFVDFSNLFGNGGLGKGYGDNFETEFERATKRLIDNGFSVAETVDGEERVWHYAVFDKSSSQARHYTCSFIADVGYGDAGAPISLLDKGTDGPPSLDERLCLGIDFPTIGGAWSKYFAYRGLYLSSGSRVDDPAIKLNEGTVLVLGSISGAVAESQIPKGVLRITNEMVDGKEIWGTATEPGFASASKLFDGEGFISPEYAQLLRKALGKDATSFQIRMPFAKGLLHEVDFRKFLKNELGVGEGATIADAFGEKRKLDSVQIVLTAEMFKCLGWLQDWCRHTDPEVDPMAYYFNQFRMHRHGLYVIGTDAGLEQSNITQLNGQFLSTLCMSQADFDEFVRTRMKKALNALNDADEARVLLLNDFDANVSEAADGKYLEKESEVDEVDEADDIDGGGDELLALDGWNADNDSDEGAGEQEGDPDRYPIAWKQALRKSKRFLNDPYIAAEVKHAVAYKLLKCARGNLDAKGRVLYLSHDLLRLLSEIASHVTDASPTSTFIKPDKFYAPLLADGVAEEAENEGYFAILRNPHLSRSEQCAARRHEDDAGVYRKYFGHLSGIVMVACDSEIPIALGGADFDGDIVRVLWEEAVVGAVLDGAYENSGNGERKRRYPVVDMEGPKPTSGSNVQGGIESIGGHITYQQLKRTLSNHIGMISNAAMRKAREAYGARLFGQEETKVMPEEDPCAIYSVATGMEIDSVKTGEDLTGKIRAICRSVVSSGEDERDKEAHRCREQLGYLRFKDEGYSSLSGIASSLLTGTYVVDVIKDKHKIGNKKLPEAQIRRKRKESGGKQSARKGDAARKTDKAKGVGKAIFAVPSYGHLREWDAYFCDLNIANVDRLSWILLDELRSHIDATSGSDDSPTEFMRLFSFVCDEDPRKWNQKDGFEAPGELANRGLRKIIGMMKAYRCLIPEKSAYQKGQEKTTNRNDFAKACWIIRSDPALGKEARANSDAQLRDVLRGMEGYFSASPEGALTTVEKALKRMKSDEYKGWSFCAPDERKGVLEELMPGFAANEDFCKVVINNNQRDGYMILFYLLRAVERSALLAKNFNLTLPNQNEAPVYDGRHDSDIGIDTVFLKKIVDITKLCLREKRPWAEWDSEIVSAFQNEIWSDPSFQGDDRPGDLVKCLHWLRVRHVGKHYFLDAPDERKLFWSLLEWRDIEPFIDEDDPMR